MGPCWLEIEGVRSSSQKVSWCSYEVEIDNAKSVRKMADPPGPPRLTVLSLRMQTMLNHQTHANEVCCVSQWS